MKLSRTLCTILSLALLGAAGGAAAQSGYPDKPIRLIIPHAPGGPTDTVARALAQAMSANMGQPVVVDSRPGGSTIIATGALATAPADGYTLMLATPEFVTNPSLRNKLPYDTLKDFVPVSRVATYPLVMVARSDFPASSAGELIAHAKARPGQLNFGSGGNGSANQLAMEMFKMQAGVNMVHVPYKGNAPAVVDLLGGSLHLMFTGMPPVISHIRAGKLKALAVSGPERSPAIPDVPTVAESGLPGFEVLAWYGVIAPAGTPAPIVARLNSEIVRAMQSAEVRQSLSGMSADTSTSTPEEFASMIRTEIERWGKVIKAAGVVAE